MIDCLLLIGCRFTIAVFSNPDAFVAADPFFFLLMSLLILEFGPGRISVDSLIKKFWFSK